MEEMIADMSTSQNDPSTTANDESSAAAGGTSVSLEDVIADANAVFGRIYSAIGTNPNIASNQRVCK